ncbi:MAG TPA: transglycosylase domain-containing protein [Gemmatimonadales bacterium]|nr:transglycosylase domain-containing protein [Gemmatimonadales bacterium]
MTDDGDQDEAPRGRREVLLGWFRTHVTRRRVLLFLAVSAVLLAFSVSVEALVRARLGPIGARVPTSFYTRPVSWHGGSAEPVAIGPVEGAANERRVPVPLDRIPEHLIDAVIAVEDQRFLDHEGLDLRRIAGAMLANVRAGGIEQGGSTITQQLAKNLFLHAGRTPMRKLREAAIATVLEQRYSKQRILEAYLNEIYLGHDHGAAIHGVGAASQYYFGKDVHRLVLSEAATLAAMIRSPNRLAPHRHPEALRSRRNLVLRLMAEQGKISAESRDQSSRVRVPTRVHAAGTVDARWFRDFASEGLRRGLPRRGAAIQTTLDARLQRAAESAVQGMSGDAEAALVAIDPRTGDVLAMVGGRDYGKSQFNRAVNARRQPGSAFKPLVALAALERDGRDEPAYTLASALEDTPLSLSTPQGLWQPVNYDGSFHGTVTLRRALEQSLNVPFARLGVQLGPDRIVEIGRRLGITSPLVAVPSIALGSSEVTLLELVRAYGVFAAGGELAETRRILAEVGGAGETRSFTQPVTHRVADPAPLFLVTSALQGVVQRGTGRGLGRPNWRWVSGSAMTMAGRSARPVDRRRFRWWPGSWLGLAPRRRTSTFPTASPRHTSATGTGTHPAVSRSTSWRAPSPTPVAAGMEISRSPTGVTTWCAT